MTNINSILTAIQSAFYDIPFENSDYQNQAFVITAQITPARAYRSIGLKMMAKIQAIEELKFNRKKEDIDIIRHKKTLKSWFTTSYKRQMAVIELEHIAQQRRWGDKLLNDAIHELNYLYAEFCKYPRYTREQFEAQECEHFSMRMKKQIEACGNGAVESLLNMHDMSQFNSIVEAENAAIERKNNGDNLCNDM